MDSDGCLFKHLYKTNISSKIERRQYESKRHIAYMSLHTDDKASQHWPEGTFSICLHCFFVQHLITVSGNENASYFWLQSLCERISMMNWAYPPSLSDSAVNLVLNDSLARFKKCNILKTSITYGKIPDFAAWFIFFSFSFFTLLAFQFPSFFPQTQNLL